LAEGGDQVRVKALVDILSGSELKPDPLKARLIRAVGAQAYGAAAQHFTRLLELKSVHHRNCVVVTLEEMANPAASDALLELWKKEKDPEIRKDILRALGPAGAGKEPARDLLLKELKAKEESHRIAAAMALGSHLSGREDVRGALKERWKKESGNEILKIAILYAYFQSKDRDAGSDIDDLIADERNGEIKEVARLVRGTLGGGPPPDPGRGGRGGRFGRGGPQGSLLRALSRLYAADKIERNAVRDLRERFTGGR
jgi:HEAT repeat protein